MEIAMFAMMIPITAIVLGVGGGIVRSILKSQERRLELRLQAQQGKNEDVTRQLEAMRAEIAGLRDTSTQFDMSLQQSVDRLESRVGRAETRVTPTPVAVSQPEQYQRTGQS